MATRSVTVGQDVLELLAVHVAGDGEPDEAGRPTTRYRIYLAVERDDGLGVARVDKDLTPGGLAAFWAPFQT